MALKYCRSLSQDVQTLAKDLKEEYQLSDYESLKLALNAEHNEILKLAFVIDSSNHTPTALEAIAIGLGYKEKKAYNSVEQFCKK